MDTNRRNPLIKTDQLAYWFFRLNGCMNIVNFLVHHEQRGREGTDVDILATRFPHRQELAMSGDPMQDHPVFNSSGKIDLIISEVKRGRCALNGPWTKPDLQNMHRVLYAVGAFTEDHIATVADALYEKNYYEDENFRCRLFAIGREKNKKLSSQVVQLYWEDILVFIFDRFVGYRYIKSQHHQWDWTGRYLYKKVMMCRHESVDAFVTEMMNRMES